MSNILTKGTHLYFIDPADNSLVRVKKLTAFNPGSSPGDDVETTDLDETVARQYEKGLLTPGSASGNIMANPQEPSHIRLHELSVDTETNRTWWVVGWSDGTAAPTVDSNGQFNLPTTRTWYEFEGHVTDFPMDFQLNSTVATALAIKRSGQGRWTKKVVA
ncbi:MAG: phage tail tube protein [Gammaproteobacteria bacterium]|nr:phage tail tube protein [Gammaproteobacteria bacterium]